MALPNRRQPARQPTNTYERGLSPCSYRLRENGPHPEKLEGIAEYGPFERRRKTEASAPDRARAGSIMGPTDPLRSARLVRLPVQLLGVRGAVVRGELLE